MALRIFIGSKSENSHEVAQQQEIIEVLKTQEFPVDIYVLLNFFVRQVTEIDCAIFTSSGPVILELKSMRGEIYGELNNDWKVVKKDGEDFAFKNLLQQLKIERSKFNQSLVDSVSPLMPLVPPYKLQNTEAWGYFKQGSKYKGSITKNDVTWFDFVTPDTLLSKMTFSNAQVHYPNEIIEKFIDDLNLMELESDVLRFKEGTEHLEIAPEPESEEEPEPLAVMFSLLGSSLTRSDIQLFAKAKQIPEGPQRIRGVAGSGKTMLLCQRAAYMHMLHPEWDIALVFFTQSLYHEIEEKVRESISRLGGTWNPRKLRILHTWGGVKRDGLFSVIRDFHHAEKIDFKTIPYGPPPEKLAYLARNLLSETSIFPMFDAILIDEGQDVIIEKTQLLYEKKQPVLWLAYQALRPVNPESPELRRLVWAYDEYQCTSTQKIPTSLELFGNDPAFQSFFSGKDRSGAQKSIIMKKCCRTPSNILVAAHVMGMGLLFKDGMLAGPTTKEEWEALGYEVDGAFKPRQEIVLTRPDKNSRNILSRAYPGYPFVGFNASFTSKREEYVFLAQSIEKMIHEDFLDPMRQLLIIPLNYSRENLRVLAEELKKKAINYYNVTAPAINQMDYTSRENIPEKFREEFAVSVSSVHRAKGNESDVVFVTDLEKIAQNESDVNLRNQLFIAMTRARGVVRISGINEYPLYSELRQAIQSGNSVKFTYNGKPKISRSCIDDFSEGYQEELKIR
jgi:superfamily I DNA and RNA helicase